MKYVKADHLGQPGSPIPMNDSEPAQQKNGSEPRSSERLCKQQEAGKIPNYSSVTVSHFPEDVSQLAATQFTGVTTVASDPRCTTNDIVSAKNAHKLPLTRVPNGYQVMNSTADQGSVCKHKAQYKCYFTQAQMVVCHMCPNMFTV